MPRIAHLIFAGVVCLTVSMLMVAVWQSGIRANTHTTRDTMAQRAHTHGDISRDQQTDADGSTPKFLVSSKSNLHPINIRVPAGPPRIELAGIDPQGRVGSVACSTCHSVRQPNLDNKTAATLDEFHQGMTFNHGNIACYACHNPTDSDALRLADGTTVAYQDVMTLCAQCHSKQSESFAHGAHGGMNGHWDLSRGPQTKNNCIDCHDPHAPNYPKMIVGFRPRDRFNEPSDDDHNHQQADSHDDH